MANIGKTYDILKSIYKIRKELVPLLVGPPGIGKTQAVYRLADELGVNVVEINANQAMPSEISGMAMPSHDSRIMEYYDDSLLLSLKDGDILFFDEVLTAPAVVLNAFLKLLMDRRLRSGVCLPDVFIVAAGNVPKSGLREFTAPQLQRFMPIFMKWDPDEWHGYLANRYGEGKIPPMDRKVWTNLILYMKREMSDVEASEYNWNNLTPRRMVQYLDWVEVDGDAAREAIDEIDHNIDLDDFLKWFIKGPVHAPKTQLEMKLQDLSEIFGISFTGVDPSKILEYAEHEMTADEFERFKKELAAENIRREE